MLSLYRELARLRKRLLDDAHRVEWIETGDRNLLAFRAGALVCATNTGDEDALVALPAGARPLLSTASSPSVEVITSSRRGDLVDNAVPANSTSWWELVPRS
ncbi:hypothetical protein [Schaalia hyovaginalis]|uniref:DUF3459 domain-containing protein n=2 Tax=Schaalia hyovaginalis TaxID=29316 RepID=A0A923E046_9ACTO|nr:hypothetical protein [Schaalia hyovaginalis]MBB6333444.1 hypothetical protein [Schaalia hyovaginalis]MBB6335746.1 hypothetical protein [Schaalia hyovaginalis]